MDFRRSAHQINKAETIESLKSQSLFLSELNLSHRIAEEDIIDFNNKIKGKIVFPWSPEYDLDRRNFNDAFPALPLLIVHVKTYNDIRECLALASKFRLQISVRSGGHSLAGFSLCDGIVIDMKELKSIYIDPVGKTAVVESGCTLEDLFMRLEDYGFHVPGGGCASVGISGYMMGGGYGLTSRQFGMNCDNVIAVFVMTANGTIVEASDSQHEDLFWSIRGGTGGNFGVLLAIKYRLHTIGWVWGIRLKWRIDTDASNAAAVIQMIQQQCLVDTCSYSLGIEVLLATDKDLYRNVYLCACWNGEEEEFRRILEPFLKSSGVQHDIPLQSGSYMEINFKLFEGVPVLIEGVKAFSRSIYIEKMLLLEDWKRILEKFNTTAPNRFTLVDMEGYGGKINKLPQNANAFFHRNASMNFFSHAFHIDDESANRKWLGEFFEFMREFGTAHSNQNYPNRDLADFKNAYWGTNKERLADVRKKYDLTGLFLFPQSV